MVGSIQQQKNGRLADTIESQSFNNSQNGLTSVGSIGSNSNGGPDGAGFFGLDGTNKFSYSGATAGILLFSQKGQDASGNEATIGTSVGPKGIKVTLTLVPASTQSTPSTQANK